MPKEGPKTRRLRWVLIGLLLGCKPGLPVRSGGVELIRSGGHRVKGGYGVDHGRGEAQEGAPAAT